MNKILVVLGMLLSFAAEAKVLVISDIDDTLKVTNVRSKAGAGSSFFDDGSLFKGMPELFQALQASYNDIEFHYVSLAPKALMFEQHEDFIKENHFPLTALHTNPNWKQDPEYKQKTIRALLAEKKPELVIYFGDNGQFDTVVYRQMNQEFKSIPEVTYIREAYSSKGADILPVLPGQVGFVTSFEVTIDLISKNILPASVYPKMEKLIYKALKKDDGDEHFGRMMYPHWMDCRDFKWQWNLTNTSPAFNFIKQDILKRCTR
ncbi:phosphatase domain-containing protein [Bdellovibrio sp. NC01]|uniref:phosphatase domain-containing protein n=1 Tax=Bdellovibrio sp. NC01 TaxID=2220073 RepID=UPI00115C34EB|nr:phosphatase domain-containing protein [Bdellovibrio sp. NC01]QDK37271.1 hypothetical protein DOE51_06540 [Bdellovibrio sp. NC01]